eukprot:9803041-Heterocapsa_arctica.AAC.1
MAPALLFSRILQQCKRLRLSHGNQGLQHHVVGSASDRAADHVHQLVRVSCRLLRVAPATFTVIMHHASFSIPASTAQGLL